MAKILSPHSSLLSRSGKDSQPRPADHALPAASCHWPPPTPLRQASPAALAARSCIKEPLPSIRTPSKRGLTGSHTPRAALAIARAGAALGTGRRPALPHFVLVVCCFVPPPASLRVCFRPARRGFPARTASGISVRTTLNDGPSQLSSPPSIRRCGICTRTARSIQGLETEPLRAGSRTKRRRESPLHPFLSIISTYSRQSYILQPRIWIERLTQTNKQARAKQGGQASLFTAYSQNKLRFASKKH